MTAGFRVLCSDGVSRHEALFPTYRDARTWQTFRHVCPFGHRIRKEAEWPVESMRLRPSLPSAPILHGERDGSQTGAEGTTSVEIDLTVEQLLAGMR